MLTDPVLTGHLFREAATLHQRFHCFQPSSYRGELTYNKDIIITTLIGYFFVDKSKRMWLSSGCSPVWTEVIRLQTHHMQMLHWTECKCLPVCQKLGVFMTSCKTVFFLFCRPPTSSTTCRRHVYNYAGHCSSVSRNLIPGHFQILLSWQENLHP